MLVFHLRWILVPSDSGEVDDGTGRSEVQIKDQHRGDHEHRRHEKKAADAIMPVVSRNIAITVFLIRERLHFLAVHEQGERLCECHFDILAKGAAECR